MSVPSAPATCPVRGRPVAVVLLVLFVMAGGLVAGPMAAAEPSAPDHLVISEVVTGGASASDEMIELYNPSSVALPLEGLELVYVSASGATVSRRAAWGVGSADVPPGHHVLIAHEVGIYGRIADAVYASGIAATGGSVALRIQGAETAIDAVGWGTATSTWLEGSPAPAPAAGSSIERLPGGAYGSTQDTGSNAVDFVERTSPDPQNSTSPPTPDPSGPPPMPTPTPSSTAVPTATPIGSPQPSATPDPGLTVVPIATARALPDGTSVTVEGMALTDSGFTDGGGFVADETGGIAVLVSDGAFARGARLRVTGTVGDRFAQRTLRSSAANVAVLGTGVDPAPVTRATGSIGEEVEGRLARIAGVIAGSPTVLSAGLAYEVDDGTSAARVVVGSATGIDTAGWASGASVTLVGVVGQRDSTGTGTSGYRFMPREPADVLHVGSSGASPTPSPTTPPTAPSPTVSPSPDEVVTIAEARAMPKNAQVRIRGVVTLVPGTVDPTSAAIQDATGAILLRMGEEAGSVTLGERVDVRGLRSTLSGMETVRVTQPVTRLGTATEPDALRVRTGEAGEAHEALVVDVRGALVTSARRVASGTVWFDVDDGSGPLRVTLGSALQADASALTAGTWVEVRGILGQETTGALPLRGYRVWPRSASEVRIAAAAPSPDAGTGAGAAAGTVSGGTAPAGGAADDATTASLAEVGGPDLADLRIGATIVVGPWDELGIGGLLWDGDRLVAIAEASAELVRGALAGDDAPIPVELTSMESAGSEAETGVPVVLLGDDAGDVVRGRGPVAAPATEPAEDGSARWVSLVGRVAAGDDAERRLRIGSGELVLDVRCNDAPASLRGTVQVLGVSVGSPARLIVPCDGVRRAPALGATAPQAAVRARAMSAGGGPTLLARAGGSPESETDRRPAAAALLCLAALALVGPAAAVRRLRGGAADEPVGGELPASADETAVPPPLGLVPVPQERRSP